MQLCNSDDSGLSQPTDSAEMNEALITLATPFHLPTNEIIIFSPNCEGTQVNREVKFSSKLDSYGWKEESSPTEGLLVTKNYL